MESDDATRPCAGRCVHFAAAENARRGGTRASLPLEESVSLDQLEEGGNTACRAVDLVLLRMDMRCIWSVEVMRAVPAWPGVVSVCLDYRRVKSLYHALAVAANDPEERGAETVRDCRSLVHL